METLRYYFYYLDSLFIGSPIIIRITVFFIFLLSTIYLLTFFRILRLEQFRIQKEKQTQKTKEKFTKALDKILFSSQNLNEEELLRLLPQHDKNNKTWQKSKLSKILVIYKQLDNLNIENYKKVLTYYKLIDFWEKRTTKGSTHSKNNAFRMLNSLTDVMPGSIFRKSANASQAVIRKHVRSRYVKYADDDVFKYLDENFDKEFNSLDAARLHDSLMTRNETRSLPPLTKWLHTSSSDEFKIFLVREIGIFKQNSAGPVLLDFFESSQNDNLKIEIAKTLGILKYEPAIDRLGNQFFYVNTAAQDAIIEMLGAQGTHDALAWLKILYPEIQNKQTMIKIIENMFKISPDTAVEFASQQSANEIEKATLAYLQRP